MGKIERIQLAPGDRERLEKLVRDRNTPQKVVWRARIVLLAGDGVGAVAVARQVGYASPFALSTAFKRVRGVSPRQHRVTSLAK